MSSGTAGTTGVGLACAVCNSATRDGGLPLLRCGGCHGILYCSKDHQKSHWSTHKPNCFAAGASGRAPAEYIVLGPFQGPDRIMFKSKPGGPLQPLLTDDELVNLEPQQWDILTAAQKAGVAAPSPDGICTSARPSPAEKTFKLLLTKAQYAGLDPAKRVAVDAAYESIAQAMYLRHLTLYELGLVRFRVAADEAHPFALRALKIFEEVFGEKDADEVGYLQVLIEVLTAFGPRFAAEAVAHADRCVSLLEQSEGKNAYNTVQSRAHAASLRASLVGGPLARNGAVEAAEKALAAEVAAHGRRDICAATAMSNLALCLESVGRRAEALPLFAEAVSSLAATVGPESETHTRVAMHYGESLLVSGDAAGARRVLEGAVAAADAASRATGRPRLQEYMRSLVITASCAANGGDLVAAEACFTRYIELAQEDETLGPTHPHVVRAVADVAVIAGGRGVGARA